MPLRRLSEPIAGSAIKDTAIKCLQSELQTLRTQHGQPDRDDEGGEHSSKGEGAGKASPIPAALLLGRGGFCSG